jgi:hypothetical protein
MKRVSVPIFHWAVIWFLGVAGAPVWAAQGPSRAVEVRILDQQGLPVDGALVVLTAKQGNVNKTAATSSGSVSIAGLAEDVYELHVQAAGFTAKTMTIDLRTGSFRSARSRRVRTISWDRSVWWVERLGSILRPRDT